MNFNIYRYFISIDLYTCVYMSGQQIPWELSLFIKERDEKTRGIKPDSCKRQEAFHQLELLEWLCVKRDLAELTDDVTLRNTLNAEIINFRKYLTYENQQILVPGCQEMIWD